MKNSAEKIQFDPDKEKMEKLKEKRDRIFSSFEEGDVMRSQSGTERIFEKYTSMNKSAAEFKLRTKWDKDKKEAELPSENVKKEKLNIRNLAGIDRANPDRQNIVDQYNLDKGDKIVSMEEDKEREIDSISLKRNSSGILEEHVNFKILKEGKDTGENQSVKKEKIKKGLFRKIIRANGEVIDLINA